MYKSAWWNQDLQHMKTKLNKKVASTLKQQINFDKKKYEKAIKNAKKQWVVNECQKMQNPFTILKLIKNINHHGNITFNDSNGNPILDFDDNAKHIVDTFFPYDTTDNPHQQKFKKRMQHILRLPNNTVFSIVNVKTQYCVFC